MLPLSPTRSHRCEVDYAPSLPLLLPAPLSTAKKEIIQFQPFPTNIPLPYLPLPTADRGTQDDHTLQPNPNCVCVCVHFFFSPPDMKKETKWVFVLCACEW